MIQMKLFKILTVLMISVLALSCTTADKTGRNQETGGRHMGKNHGRSRHDEGRHKRRNHNSGKDRDYVGMPNPASVYCEEQGGKSVSRKNSDGSEYGVCVFEDGKEIEEWEYFRQNN